MHDNTEWRLHPLLFEKICKTYGRPEIDLFASRLNKQLPKYCSWKPDPGAWAVDAMAVDWSDCYFYAFPPFNMIGRVLQKIEFEHATGILIVPYWPTQHWFSKFTQLCINVPSILFSREATPPLSHPWRDTVELPQKTRLLAALISGKPSRTWESKTKQNQSSCPHGERALEHNIRAGSNTGICFVIQGVLVQCHQI